MLTLIITDNKRRDMKYYKIINSESGHHGLFYKEGRNIDPLPFNPHGNCEKGGIYFAREDIFWFWKFGDEVYEVTPISEIYENPGFPNKWKAREIDLKYIGKKYELKTIKELVEDGADIHVNNDFILRMASTNGYLDIVKYLISQGANIHSSNDYVLCCASYRGHLDVVKCLIEHGADIHARNDLALVWASMSGHIEIVKYLVEQGADIHAENDQALRWASEKGHLEIVKYLVEQGADVHACNDEALCWALDAGHKEIVKFLKSCE